LEWDKAISLGRRQHLDNTRPLGGASRTRLTKQIEQLTRDKADLQAQLAAIVLDRSTAASASSSYDLESAAAVEQPNYRRKNTTSANISEEFDQNEGVDGDEDQGGGIAALKKAPLKEDTAALALHD